MNEIYDTHEYTEFVNAIKTRIVTARVSAARAISKSLIALYWDLGRMIVEKQEMLGWGKSVVESLSKDIQRDLPGVTGYSPDNLWRMRQFYVEYTDAEFLEQVVPEIFRMLKDCQNGSNRPGIPFLEQLVPEFTEGVDPNNPDAPATREWAGNFFRKLVAQIPWGHNVLIIKKVKDAHARLYYLNATVQLGWSRNTLLNQIKAGAYERSVAQGKTHNFESALPVHYAEQADEMLKSSYNLEFLGVGKAIQERELERMLISQLKEFILELGYGFCFIGNQYRVTLGENQYFIDLLFYHRFLKALICIELKTGKFKPEYAGKMDFYLNLLNKSEKAPEDNPSIGIILCAEKDNLEVEYSLRTKQNPIGVAEYKLYRKLPRELRGKLPSKKELSKALQNNMVK